MLWYNVYNDTLKGMSFELNPYYKCTANKMIIGKQCTVLFHVDDNKISRVDSNVVTELMNKVSEHFGELAITRGDTNDFLGLRIKVRKDGLIAIDQIGHIENALKMFGPTRSYNVSSPCAQQLWTKVKPTNKATYIN